MSGTRELKALILMLDEHRQNLGNSQYAFPLDSESREVLRRFSSAIPRMRPEAFRRLKEIFVKHARWAERHQDIVEITADYVWSLVYPLWRSESCNEANYSTHVEQQRHAFLATVEAIDISRNPSVLAWVKEQGMQCFQYELEALALHYCQQKERAALEQEM